MQIPDWQDKTAEECLAWLLETEQVPSGRGRLTHDWVAKEIDLDVADAIYAAVAAVSPPTALRYNVGSGIDTSSSTWKEQATAVAAANPALAAHAEVLRDFEIITRPRWAGLGYAVEPTLDQIAKERFVAATRAEIAARLRKLTAKSNAVSGWLDILDTSGMTPDAVQSYCDDLLGSDTGNPTGGQ